MLPHVASDRRVHGLAGSAPSIVRRAPAGRVCPPGAIILPTAHSFSSLLDSLDNSVAWGGPQVASRAWIHPRGRRPLPGKKCSERCKMRIDRTARSRKPSRTPTRWRRHPSCTERYPETRNPYAVVTQERNDVRSCCLGGLKRSDCPSGAAIAAPERRPCSSHSRLGGSKNFTQLRHVGG